MTNPYQMERTQAEHEARAKIFWGDEPQVVFNFLLGNGITYEEATEWVDGMLVERWRAIRGAGVRRMLTGAAMLLVPVFTFVLLASSGLFSVKIFGISLAVGLWGAWKVMKGMFLFFAPKGESGDVSDL